MKLKEIAQENSIMMRRQFPRGVFEYSLQTYALNTAIALGTVLSSINEMTKQQNVNKSESERVAEFINKKSILEQNIARLLLEIASISAQLDLDLDAAVAKELNLPTKET